MKHLLAIVPALLLAACAGNPQSSASRTALGPPTAQAEAVSTAPVYTGTRLTNRGTDRTVRSIGNAGAREDAQSVQSLGNAVGARSN